MAEKDKDTLTPKQQRFVDAYLGVARFNAAEAARLAGYAARSAPEIGRENLRKPTVQAAIRDRVNEYAMSAEEVLAGLTDIARSDFTEFMTEPEVGKVYLDLKKALQGGAFRLVKKLTYTEFGPSLELYDKQSALVTLGKYHKLWVERTQNDTVIDVTQLTDEELEAIARAKSQGGTRAKAERTRASEG